MVVKNHVGSLGNTFTFLTPITCVRMYAIATTCTQRGRFDEKRHHDGTYSRRNQRSPKSESEIQKRGRAR